MDTGYILGDESKKTNECEDNAQL